MILIALGGNLVAVDGRTPYQLCQAAVGALADLSGLDLVTRSRWYRSAPVPRSDQPDYVNGMVRLEASADRPEPEPAALLEVLQLIEAAHGRERGLPNAARTLDLDIIAMGPNGALCRSRPDPILPHPRLQDRRFVLLPLHDVAPDWVHPILGMTADQLLTALPPVCDLDGAVTPID